MDIRARLLLAFVPLLALLLGIAIALPFIQRASLALLQRQGVAADTLADVQSLELSIMHEMDAVSRIVEGGAANNHERYQQARRQAAALFDELFSGPSPLPQAREMKSYYLALARRHELALSNLRVGNEGAARAAMLELTTGGLRDGILKLSDQAKAESRVALDAATTELQRSQQAALTYAAIGMMAGVALALALTWVLVGQVVGPLNRLTADAERHAAGDAAEPLSHGGNTVQVRRLRDAFQRLLDANQARQKRVEAARDELERRIVHEEQLRATVEALSVPVVPLRAGTLLLPLVGHLDQRRAEQLTETLLAAIQERRAKAVVLDITGLAGLNDETVHQLRQTAEAARLLGCRVTLVGVRADQAMALVAGDLATEISTARDIPSVLADEGGA